MGRVLRALQWFGFRQALKGALIVGAVAGGMMLVQGAGYIKSYPDLASQHEFTLTLLKAPSLGFIYGSTDDLRIGAEGYMVYRVLAVMSLVVAIWSLMTVTRLLRGNEEDGRYEMLRTSAASPVAISANIVLGFLYAFAIAFVIASLLTWSATGIKGIVLSAGDILLMNAAMFGPGLVFAGVGVLISQLAVSRRRALLYGLLPLLGFFLLRSIGNVVQDLHWLLKLTPFGWAQLSSPLLEKLSSWLALFVVWGAMIGAVGLVLNMRDLGSSILPERTTQRPRYYLLGGPLRLALRSQLGVLIAWGLAACSVTAIVGAISKLASQASVGSSGLTKSLSAISGNADNITISFLSFGTIMVAILMMIVAATTLSAIRSDEAKHYLDTILAAPVRPLRWLPGRLGLGLTAMAIIGILAGLVLFVVAKAQGVPVEFGKSLAMSVASLGAVIFLLGFGCLVYSLRPSWAVIGMYIVIAWSFIIDLLSATGSLSPWLLKTSLLHYLSFNLAAWPDWSTVLALSALGLAMVAAGLYVFKRRDIVTD